MENALVKTERSVGSFVVTPKDALDQLREVEAVVKGVMKPGEHYGIIPGTQKPTLLKPGAELLCNMYRYVLSDLIIIDKVEQWEVPVSERSFPLFRYMMKAVFTDRDGQVVATGIGECNSYESRYRWRDAKLVCPVCKTENVIKGRDEYGGGWLCFKKRGGCGAKFPDGDKTIEDQPRGKVPNEAIYDQINTITKIAKKRAFVDATLSATRTSGMFTQDMEDFATVEEVTHLKQLPADAAVGVGVDPKTGEIVTVPANCVVPIGLRKGKDVRDLPKGDLIALSKLFETNPEEMEKHKEFVVMLKKYLGDPFGGVFDEQGNRLSDEDAEKAKDDHMKLIVEIRELMEQIIPKFNAEKPRLRKEEKELAARIVAEAFQVSNWKALTELSNERLRDGIPALAKLVETEYIDQQKRKAAEETAEKDEKTNADSQ